MSNNIGYAIFKKTSSYVSDSNGMFEELQLTTNIDSIIDNLIHLKEAGQKVLCFERISSKNGKEYPKDAYLVILIERVQANNADFILGSAICFKQFQVNENKIIDGVQYLLSQLKRNFENDYDVEDKDLGVILPSTNKDFKIFKNKQFSHTSTKEYSFGFDKISFTNNEAKQYLHHFCNHKALTNFEYLLLTSSQGLLTELDNKDNNYKKLSKEVFTSSNEVVKKSIVAVEKPTEEINEIKKKLKAVISERDKVEKDKKLFKTLFIIFFCALIPLGISFFANITYSPKGITNSSLYPIEDTLYISHSGYNVNVRSSPEASPGDGNIKTVLSDGDKVFVLGFDKKTLWAKIRYNEGKEIGYVSNRLISKKIAKNRVQPVNKKGYISFIYSGVPIYPSPKEIGKQNPEIMTYLYENDKIFVKNKDLRLNSYSVRFQKHNKIYHGYVERQNFSYQ